VSSGRRGKKGNEEEKGPAGKSGRYKRKRGGGIFVESQAKPEQIIYSATDGFLRSNTVIPAHGKYACLPWSELAITREGERTRAENKDTEKYKTNKRAISLG